MLDVQVGYLANQAMNFLVSGKPPRRSGNAHPNIQPQDVFACRDGHMALAVGNDGQFEKFCAAVGHAEWAQDPRFIKNADRVRNREALTALIADTLAQGDVRDWVARIEAAGVPCAVDQSGAGARWRKSRSSTAQMLRHLPHPLAGTRAAGRQPDALPGDAAVVRPAAAAARRAHRRDLARAGDRSV